MAASTQVRLLVWTFFKSGQILQHVAKFALNDILCSLPQSDGCVSCAFVQAWIVHATLMRLAGANILAACQDWDASRSEGSAVEIEGGAIQIGANHSLSGRRLTHCNSWKLLEGMTPVSWDGNGLSGEGYSKRGL